MIHPGDENILNYPLLLPWINGVKMLWIIKILTKHEFLKKTRLSSFNFMVDLTVVGFMHIDNYKYYMTKFYFMLY